MIVTTTWFKTTRHGREIEPVEVIKSTEATVTLAATRWYGERRARRISTYECFYPTWEAAHAALMDDAEKSVTYARLELDRAQGRLGNIKGLKPASASTV